MVESDCSDVSVGLAAVDSAGAVSGASVLEVGVVSVDSWTSEVDGVEVFPFGDVEASSAEVRGVSTADVDGVTNRDEEVVVSVFGVAVVDS